MPRANKRHILYYDDLDARREIFRLMGYSNMSDRRRKNFIDWCLKRCPSNLTEGTRVGQSFRDGGYGVNEAVADFTALSMQFGLDVDAALQELTRRVRRR